MRAGPGQLRAGQQAGGGAHTIPYRRSRARRRMDSSLSSRHCRTRSLWACTDLGCVLRILDMASRPRYFTAEMARCS